jgi:hypothetical protein
MPAVRLFDEHVAFHGIGAHWKVFPSNSRGVQATLAEVLSGAIGPLLLGMLDPGAIVRKAIPATNRWVPVEVSTLRSTPIARSSRSNLGVPATYCR